MRGFHPTSERSALLRLSPRTTPSVDTVRLALKTHGIEPSPGDATYTKRPWLAGVTTFDGKPGLEAVKKSLKL